jgi:hypothetical protein
MVGLAALGAFRTLIVVELRKFPFMCCFMSVLRCIPSMCSCYDAIRGLEVNSAISAIQHS